MTSNQKASCARTAALVATVALLVCACSTSGTGGAGTETPTGAQLVPDSTASAPVAPSQAGAANPPAPSVGSSRLAVTSSVADGPLTVPAEWITTVTGIGVSDPIDHVDFLVDGVTTWTSTTCPTSTTTTATC